MTVAIADDEKNIRLAVKTALEKEGLTVLEFSDGKSVLERWQKDNNFCSLFILDIMMPVMDGLALLTKLRASGAQTPVMFLTSRDEEFDKVLGLEMGADDYLCKPFSIKELIARVHVLLRRISIQQIPSAKISCGEFTLDTNSYTALKNNVPLQLTVTEFRLLQTFLQNASQVLTREQLIQAAYPEDIYLNDRAIDCHIKRLRKKIGSDKIETVYGLGYRFI